MTAARPAASPLGSFVVSAPRWIQPSEQGVEIGALATGEGDITDVGDDVSARHAHIWCDAQNPGDRTLDPRIKSPLLCQLS